MVKNILRRWTALALVISAVSGLAYLLAQQNQRQAANDPQIQWAEDGAVQLAGGALAADVVPAQTVDVGRSLAPFMLVFDDGGRLLAASGQLHGQPPSLPAGVLDYVRQHGEDRITWQPEPGVRLASVIRRYAGTQSGFILAARSLRETERRVDQFGQLTLLAWAVSLAAALAWVGLSEFIFASR